MDNRLRGAAQNSEVFREWNTWNTWGMVGYWNRVSVLFTCASDIPPIFLPSNELPIKFSSSSVIDSSRNSSSLLTFDPALLRFVHFSFPVKSITISFWVARVSRVEKRKIVLIFGFWYFFLYKEKGGWANLK